MIFANPLQTDTSPTINQHIKNAVMRVESARESTLSALQKMVTSVDTARKNGIENNNSIQTKILETHAISQIAKGTAAVEIAKAKSMALITQAIDTLDPSSLEIVSNAVADVEIAKAKAKEMIAKATQKVELSKTQAEKVLVHPEETLTIAKNVSAIEIAKSVAQTEVAKAVSLIEIAKSSVENVLPNSIKTLTTDSKARLEKIKAQATANISSYLAKIEVMKANMLAKIAEEVAKVEIAKLEATQAEINASK